MFLSFVFDELVSCLNDREEKNDLFRICLHGFICSFFVMWPIIPKTISRCLFHLDGCFQVENDLKPGLIMIQEDT